MKRECWYWNRYRRVEYYSGHRVDLADGDDGKVVFQVLQTTPIVLASGTYKRDRELERIILQFLCETRTRLDNYGHTLRAGNKRFPRKCGKYDNAEMTFASAWVTFAFAACHEFKRTIISGYEKILIQLYVKYSRLDPRRLFRTLFYNGIANRWLFVFIYFFLNARTFELKINLWF